MRSLKYDNKNIDNTEIHKSCYACGKDGNSLGLSYNCIGDNSVYGEWFCNEKYQGYPGIVHGGIIAVILDSAMTNCLLKHGISAVTADLHIRYLKPVKINSLLRINASIVRSHSPLFILKSHIAIDNIIYALADAKFMESCDWSEPDNV